MFNIALISQGILAMGFAQVDRKGYEHVNNPFRWN